MTRLRPRKPPSKSGPVVTRDADGRIIDVAKSKTPAEVRRFNANQQAKAARARPAANGTAQPRHGRTDTYERGCRCEPCCRAQQSQR